MPDQSGNRKGRLSTESKELLDEGMRHLRAELRDAVALHNLEEGISNAAAAKTLNISVPTLKNRACRGRRALRAFLAPYLSDTGDPLKRPWRCNEVPRARSP